MKISKFTVFGQRCSGTNALIRLIETNMPTLEFSEDVGFKHWLVPDQRAIPQDMLVIVIAREVAQWLRSLHRNPWHVEPDMKVLAFSEFIRAEWRTRWDEDFWGITPDDPRYGTPIAEERCLQSGMPFKNAIEMRTAKLRNWTGLRGRSVAYLPVSHSRFVSNPEDVLTAVAEATGHRAITPYIPATSYKGQGEREFIVKKYDALSRDDETFVQRFLDAEIECQFV